MKNSLRTKTTKLINSLMFQENGHKNTCGHKMFTPFQNLAVKRGFLSSHQMMCASNTKVKEAGVNLDLIHSEQFRQRSKNLQCLLCNAGLYSWTVSLQSN